MLNYTFRTIIEPDEPSGYHGFVPALKGLHTCGESIEEVKKNLQDAISCHIQGTFKNPQKNGFCRISSGGKPYPA